MPFDSDDRSSTTTTRRGGGGPPGSSAFLSSRLRRAGEEREAAARRQQDSAFIGMGDRPEAGGQPERSDAGTTTATWDSPASWEATEDWSTPSWDSTETTEPAPSWDSAQSWDATSSWESSSATTTETATPDETYTNPNWGDGPSWTSDPEPVASAPQAEPAAPRAGQRASSFPGGRVKLPRLSDLPRDNPDLTFVGTAFVRKPGEDEEADDGKGAFEEYFTYESLFDAPIADPLKTDSTLQGDDPYFVLGVDPEAPWREIVSAHRALVKTHHPDRLVGASPTQIAESEEALRLINRAYSELRRRGRDAEDDA